MHLQDSQPQPPLPGVSLLSSPPLSGTDRPAFSTIYSIGRLESPSSFTSEARMGSAGSGSAATREADISATACKDSHDPDSESLIDCISFSISLLVLFWSICTCAADD